MERLEKIKRSLNTIESLLGMCDRLGIAPAKSTYGLLFREIDEARQHVKELGKIQNLSNTSTKKATSVSNSDNTTGKFDAVNNPKHYTGGAYQCIDVMLDVFGKEKVSAFCELNAFKYQWRANNKGADIQDKQKAIWYNQKYIDLNNDKV